MAKKITEKAKCPKNFTLINGDDSEQNYYYGRCNEKSNKVEIAEVENVEKWDNPKYPKGFYVSLTEFNPDDLDPKSDLSQEVVKTKVLEPDDYMNEDILMKALDHKEVGNGETIILDEKNDQAEMVFKNKPQAINFMETELPNWIANKPKRKSKNR